MRPLTTRPPRVTWTSVFPMRYRARRTVSRGSSSRRSRRSRGAPACRELRLPTTKSGQRHVLVGEPTRIDAHAIANEICHCRQLAGRLRVLRIAAAVEADGGADEPVLQVEAQEDAPPGIAAEDDAIPAGREAHVFDQVLVLIRPEGVQIVVGLGAAQH